MLAVLLLALATRAAVAAEDAATLVGESMERYRQGDAATDGWREIYDEGIRLAERAIELDPKNADARYALFLNIGSRASRAGLGAQLLTVRRLRTLLDETIDLDPRHAHAWEARGEMLSRLPRLLGGSTAEAEKAYRRSAELDPRWWKPRLRLAELIEKERPEEALSLSEQARALACDGEAPTAENCARATALAVAIRGRSS